MGKSQRQRLAESIQREELVDELERIIEHGKRIQKKRSELKVCYEKWYFANDETIKTLTELRDKILVVSTAANAASTVGSLVEIFGGVLCIAGAITDKRNLVETGDKITKGGNLVNLGSTAIRGICLREFCDTAMEDFETNEVNSKMFERQRYSYFQQPESFKRELRTLEASSSLPLLLETAQREGIDFLGDLGLSENAKSKLRTNLRQMCRANAKKIKATTETVRPHDFGRVFASEIRGLLFEFKELLDQDESLSSIFSEHTKKFLSERINDVVPYLDTAESYLTQYSGMELLQAGTSILRVSSFLSASQSEVGVASGVSVMLSFGDLIRRIDDLNSGSKSKESEELTKRIEKMKTMRQNIIEEMKKFFGWQEPIREHPFTRPALGYYYDRM